MALTLLYQDDFTGHANNAAFLAAYPKDEPGDTSTSVINLTWSSTNGPGSTPGIAPTVGAGFFHKRHVNPQGYLFRLVGEFDCSSSADFLFTMYWHQAGTGWPGGTRADDIVQVSRNSGVGGVADLTFFVRTVDSGMYDPDYWHAFGTIPTNTTSILRIDGCRSSLTETSPGVFAPNDDGFAQFYVDGVLQAEFIGAVWHGDSSRSESAPYWNSVQVQPTGRMGDFQIWHDPGGSPGSPGSPGPPTSGTARNLLTGLTHTVEGSDDVIAGESGEIVGDRVALFNMKSGDPYTFTGNNAFIVRADTVEINGASLSALAPTGASYVTLAANATLTAERVLTAGTGITLTDGGANSTITIAATGAGSAPVAPTFVTLTTDATLTNERVLTAGTGITVTDAGAGSTVTIAATGAASGPVGSSYVTVPSDATLTSERVLTGTTNQVIVTDGGANTTVTLSTPQDLHTGAVVQFARMGMAVAADSSAKLKVAGQYGSTTYDAGNSGASKTLDWDNENTQLLTMTGNCTLTLSNPKDGFRYLIFLLQSSGSNTISWPSAVKWKNATAPTLTTTAGRCDLVTMVYVAALGSGNYLAAANLNYTPA